MKIKIVLKQNDGENFIRMECCCGFVLEHYSEKSMSELWKRLESHVIRHGCCEEKKGN